MTSLISLFSSINPPDRRPDGALRLAARSVDGPGNLRIAKDADGLPAVLIPETDENATRPPIRLRNLNILFGAPCHIEIGSTFEFGHYTVIRCLDGSPEMTRYFLAVSIAALQANADDFTSTTVHDVVAHLTELFRLLANRPSRSIRGLWAELFIIARSRDPVALLKAWHSTNSDLHDFNDGSARLEVKGAARERRHRFSADQLTDPGVPLFIASLLVEQSPGGESISDLRTEICERIAWNADLVQKLDLMIAEALGDTVTTAAEDYRFDVVVAHNSLRFYVGASVPHLEPPFPKGISNVEFDVDLSDAPQLESTELDVTPVPLIAAARPSTL